MHFLGARARGLHGLTLQHRRAAVYVRAVERNLLQVACPHDVKVPIVVLKIDTLLARLPLEVRVVGPDGDAIKATHNFYVTLESFDPWHLLTDME